MLKRPLSLLRLCAMTLACACLAAPSFADFPDMINDPDLPHGHVCAILLDHPGTAISITDLGTATETGCHGKLGIQSEAYAVCVLDPKTRQKSLEIGAVDLNVIGTVTVNLLPSVTGGPFNLCRPFWIPKFGAAPFFLVETAPGSGIYDLDAQPIGPGNSVKPLPLGALVQVITDNKPEAGLACIGVRTTIQTMKGTCKIWKTRKYYNTCKTTRTISSIKEFEGPFNEGNFSAKAGPGSTRTSVALTVAGQFITLQSGGNLGGTPFAGSVDNDDAFDEFFFCGVSPFFTSALTPTPPATDFRVQEIILDYTAVFRDSNGKPIGQGGGVTLQPVAKPGSEKFVDFHIDFE